MTLEGANTTFVTAFIDLNEPREEHRSPQAYLAEFLRLARTGIPIHLFVSYSYIPLLLPLQSFPNVYVEPINLENLDLSKALASYQFPLPPQRSLAKDTRNFMILMNAKVELVDSAIRHNHFGTGQFAWIDFRIFHVLREEEASAVAALRRLATLQLKGPAVLIPGCWEKGVQGGHLFRSINWRFCGGFFLGDAASLQSFYELYTEYFLETLLIKPNATLTWEVNFWHYLELHHGFNPIWYKADHNDTILQLPFSAFLEASAGHLKLPAATPTECGKVPEPETSNAL